MSLKTTPITIETCLFDDSFPDINIADLRRIASQGICDQASHRSVAWRILLGFLPLNRNEWPAVLDKKRSLYQELVQQVFSSPPPNKEGMQLMGHHGKQAAQHLLREKQEAVRQQAQDEIDTVLVEGVMKVGINHGNDAKDNDGVVKTCDNDATGGADAETETTNEENEHAEDDKEQEDGDTTVSSPPPATSSTTRHTSTTAAAAGAAKSWKNNVQVVPDGIRDEWKKSGRDITGLVDSMSNAAGKNVYGINTLLVNTTCNTTVDDTTTQQDQDEDDEKWNSFLENASLLDEIRKDVVRTHPDLKFFLEPSDNLGHRRYAAIERILFVWAKLNKGVRYVQGMNEIVGTLYFVLANDFHEEWACHAEADTYHLFNTLMAEMSDIFVAELDNHDTGIQGRINNMNSLLKLHDPEVSTHLEEVGIHASFYAIRWLTTLLSREFLLPDTIRLWDSMFASTHKDNFLRYVCVTMVMVIREELLKSDFSACLRLLQSYPPTNLDSLLQSSRALWIYESQITLACHKGGISLSQALCTISPPPTVVMAYGLVGGVAIVRRMNNNGSSDGTTTTAAADTTTTAPQQAGGRAFLTGAKDYLREAAKSYQSRRGAASNDAATTARGTASSNSGTNNHANK